MKKAERVMQKSSIVSKFLYYNLSVVPPHPLTYIKFNLYMMTNQNMKCSGAFDFCFRVFRMTKFVFTMFGQNVMYKMSGPKKRCFEHCKLQRGYFCRI